MQEVLAVVLRVVWIDERLAESFLVAVSRDRRQLGDQPIDRDLYLLWIVRKDFMSS